MAQSQWLSHTLLQPAAEAWVQARTGFRPWLPGPMREHRLPRGTQTLDVVLFGDFLDQLACFRRWPLRYKNYRLWVLSNAVRDVCVDVVGLSRDEVGVIPRAGLFPAQRSAQALPRLDQPFTLVYSGRLTLVKNFDIFLRLASDLQTRKGLRDMRVVALGPYPQNRGMDFSLHFNCLILTLPWTSPPEIVADLPPAAWIKKSLLRPVLVATSKQRREDFGVSVAQARAQGWPCILSDWGGHRDVSGKGVLRFPASLVPDEKLRRLSRDAYDPRLADWLITRWKRAASTPPRSKSQLVQPVTLERLAELETKHWRQIRRYGSKRWLTMPSAKNFVAAYDASFGAT